MRLDHGSSATLRRVSPLGAGRGYWRYIPTAGGVRFCTGYDYTGDGVGRLTLSVSGGWWAG